MKRFYAVLFIASIFISGCSKLKEDIAEPVTLSLHQAGISDPASPNFHGKLFTQLKKGFASCQQCHAKDLNGGNTGKGCINCHPSIGVHKAGIGSPDNADFHGKFIKNHSWDITSCKTCHGSDFSGKSEIAGCKNSGCHTGTKGPEECNTCHGEKTDPARPFPPKDLSGNMDVTASGVGAHQSHLVNTKYGQISCQNCHTVPESVYAADHFDASPRSEVIFTMDTGYGGSLSTYNYADNTCSNTYCHGNFSFAKSKSQNQFAYTEDVMPGNNMTVKWTNVGTDQAKCGTCHGLPPKGHMSPQPYTCGFCHWDGQSFDKAKHANGKINALGKEY